MFAIPYLDFNRWPCRPLAPTCQSAAQTVQRIAQLALALLRLLASAVQLASRALLQGAQFLKKEERAPCRPDDSWSSSANFVPANRAWRCGEAQEPALDPDSPLTDRTDERVGISTLQRLGPIRSFAEDGHSCYRAVFLRAVHLWRALSEDGLDRLSLHVLSRFREMRREISDHSHIEFDELWRGGNLEIAARNLVKFIGDCKACEIGPSSDLYIGLDRHNDHLINNLRRASSAYGLYCAHRLHPDRLMSALAKGRYGARCSGIYEYVQLMENVDPSRDIFSGGDLELRGLSELFDLSIGVFDVEGLGKEVADQGAHFRLDQTRAKRLYPAINSPVAAVILARSRQSYHLVETAPSAKFSALAHLAL